MALWNLVIIGSDNGLLPDGTKPLSEPMMTCHQHGIHLWEIPQEVLKIFLLKWVWNRAGASTTRVLVLPKMINMNILKTLYSSTDFPVLVLVCFKYSPQPWFENYSIAITSRSAMGQWNDHQQQVFYTFPRDSQFFSPIYFWAGWYKTKVGSQN